MLIIRRNNREDYQDNDAPLLHEESRRQQELVRLDHEIEYNEALIADRETSIVEIEQAINEVNEIFRDLGTMVNDQQGMIGNFVVLLQLLLINLTNLTLLLR